MTKVGHLKHSANGTPKEWKKRHQEGRVQRNQCEICWVPKKGQGNPDSIVASELVCELEQIKYRRPSPKQKKWISLIAKIEFKMHSIRHRVAELKPSFKRSLLIKELFLMRFVTTQLQDLWQLAQQINKKSKSQLRSGHDKAAAKRFKVYHHANGNLISQPRMATSSRVYVTVHPDMPSKVLQHEVVEFCLSRHSMIILPHELECNL